MVSVIVPIYNMKEFLPTCIESLMMQTWSDLEIILVDDGSTDGSAQLCDEYAARDSRIVVLHKENGGVSSARNSALDIMRGEFVCFVDPDDFAATDMVEKLYLEQQRTNADIVVCGYQLYWSDEQTIDVVYTQKINPDLQSVFESLLFNDEISNYSWNKLYRVNLFREIRYPEGKVYEDINTVYRVLALSSKTVIIPDILYFYRQRPASLSKSPKYQSLVDQIYAIQERNLYICERFPEFIDLADTNELKFSVVNFNQIAKAYGWREGELAFFAENISRLRKRLANLPIKYKCMGYGIRFTPHFYARLLWLITIIKMRKMK